MTRRFFLALSAAVPALARLRPKPAVVPLPPAEKGTWMTCEVTNGGVTRTVRFLWNPKQYVPLPHWANDRTQPTVRLAGRDREMAEMIFRDFGADME